MQWIKPLCELSTANVLDAGNTAARLGFLLQANQPVPSGFVVTVDAFFAHFETIPAEGPVRPELVDSFRQELLAAFDQTFSPGEHVAVRCSHVDDAGEGACASGRYGTYYFVPRPRLANAVIDCWMTVWSPAAIAYRSAHEVEQPAGMGVLVQRMVRADAAGTCSSTDPHGTWPSLCTVEAAHGLGAGVADGRTAADLAVVSWDDAILVRETRPKNWKVTRCNSGHDAAQLDEMTTEQRRRLESRIEPVPAHQQLTPVLNDDELIRVARAARRAADLFDEPQTLDWALENGELRLLQSRDVFVSEPVSPHAPEPSTACASSGPHTVSVSAETTDSSDPTDEKPLLRFAPVTPSGADPLTPLSQSLLAPMLEPACQFHEGRVFLDITWLRRLAPFAADDAGLARWATATTTDLSDVPRMRPVAMLTSLFWSGIAYITSDAYRSGTERRRRSNATRTDARLEGLLTERSCAPAAALRTGAGTRSFRRFTTRPLLAGTWWRVHRRSLSVALVNAARRWTSDQDTAALARWLNGDQPRTVERNAALDHLATLAAEHPDVSSLLTAPEHTYLNGLGSLAVDHPFVALLEAFVTADAAHSVNILELSAPRLRENCVPVLTEIRDRLRRNAARPHNVTSLHARLRDRSDTSYADASITLEARLRAACAHRWQRIVISTLFRRIRNALDAETHCERTAERALDATRIWIERLDHDLWLDQRIPCAGDAYALNTDELAGLTAGTLVWSDVEQHVRARRQAFRRQLQAPAPTVLNLPELKTEDTTAAAAAPPSKPSQPVVPPEQVTLPLDEAPAMPDDRHRNMPAPADVAS